MYCFSQSGTGVANLIFLSPYPNTKTTRSTALNRSLLSYLPFL